MCCGADGFAVAMRVCGVNTAFNHVVMHEAINDIGTFSLRGAKHKGMPEKITFVNEGVCRYALAFPKIFEGIIGVQGLCSDYRHFPPEEIQKIRPES